MKLLGHPLHAILSDFPIVLLVCGAGCDGLGWWLADAFFWRVGGLAGAAAMAFVVPMAVTGLWDLRKIASTPHVGIAIWHLSLMLSAISLYGLALLLRGALTQTLVVTFETIAIAVAFGGAWFGGHLVFAHGVGVEDRNC